MKLDAYFDRIGFSGACSMGLPLLRDLVFQHATSIPFENVDVLLGKGISLELEAIHRKLVESQRGGYCFEHGALLMSVLQELGFPVRPLSARVRLQVPAGVTPPRSHLFLRVQIDGVPWAVDVGLGSLSATGPFRLDVENTEQEIPHEPRRIVRTEGEPFPKYFHQARLGDQWIDVSEFTLEEMPPIDREAANWWTSTYPHARFRQNLLVALPHRDGTRSSLQNKTFIHRHGARIIEQFEIGDRDHLVRILSERFQIAIPKGTRIDASNLNWES
jgi:arylamine N-acetyltransferase